MSVAKHIEVTAGSRLGLEDAINQGVARASDSLDNVEGAWVKDIKVLIEKGKVAEWRVNMMVTFILKD